MELIIVDIKTKKVLPPGEIGEIWLYVGSHCMSPPLTNSPVSFQKGLEHYERLLGRRRFAEILHSLEIMFNDSSGILFVAATNKAITPDGWFKSGDSGCKDEEGFLYIKDRSEHLLLLKMFDAY